MVDFADLAITTTVVLVLGISLLNPGGSMVAFVIIALLVALYFLVPFVKEYVLSVNKGRAARKTPGTTDNSSDKDS